MFKRSERTWTHPHAFNLRGLTITISKFKVKKSKNHVNGLNQVPEKQKLDKHTHVHTTHEQDCTKITQEQAYEHTHPYA